MLSDLIDEKLKALAARRAADKLRTWIHENMICSSGNRNDRLIDDLRAIRDIITLDIEHIDETLAEETEHIREDVRCIHEITETLDAEPCAACGGREATCNCECGDHYCGCPCHVDEGRRAKAALAVKL